MKEKPKKEPEICESCGAMIDKESDWCPACQLSRKVKTELIPEMKRETGELISLFKISDSIEAQFIRMMLEDEGIPCMISEGGMTSVLGTMTSPGLSSTWVKIMVQKSRAADALKVLAGHKKWGEKELARYLSMLDEVK